MKNIVKPENLIIEDLKQWLINVDEKYYIELKKVSELSNAFWESYSSFYFNHRGNNPRWSDRVSDDEPGDYEMYLYNFYNIVQIKNQNLISRVIYVRFRTIKNASIGI